MKTTLFRIIYAMIFGFAAVSCSGDLLIIDPINSVLQGTVTDEDGNGVMAKIAIDELELYTYSSSAIGNYFLCADQGFNLQGVDSEWDNLSIEPGLYTVTIVADGYVSQTIIIEIYADQRTNYDFVLVIENPTITISTLYDGFDMNNYPSSNTWIVDDSTLSYEVFTSDLDNLNTKCYIGTIYLYAAMITYCKDNNECISLELSNLETVNIFDLKDGYMWIGDWGEDPLSNVESNMLENCISEFIAPNATDISSVSWSDFTYLERVEISQITNIESREFTYCSNLKTLIASSTTTVEALAFADCLKLENVELATTAKLQYIAANAFSGCIPSQITLTTSVENAEFVDGNILNIGESSFEFRNIILQ